MNAVGLSYIKLGQAATTLSGGEAQRVKLATERSRRQTGRTRCITGNGVTDVSSAFPGTSRRDVCYTFNPHLSPFTRGS